MAVILLHGKKAGAKKVFSLKSNIACQKSRPDRPFSYYYLIPFFGQASVPHPRHIVGLTPE